MKDICSKIKCNKVELSKERTQKTLNPIYQSYRITENSVYYIYFNQHGALSVLVDL